uniref:Transmembrane protein n=1 Tax=Pithovirus LCPAC201 TaxID=2506591 RepID=A0A481Z4Z0_9VIRU|nr:MAG: hypothetical protein LCPAC201_02350 [Pithovirus LCPAC201]
MDTITAIIIVIVIVIIIICLNAFFIYSPVRKIEREVDSTIEDIDGLITVAEKNIIPLVENGSEKFVSLIEKSFSLEAQVDNIINTAGCIFCRSPFNLNGMFCDGDVLKSPSIICATK